MKMIMRSNKVVRNAKWIVFCRIIQSVLQLLIGMITARYLGPSNYGLINYAASVVAFVLPMMQLGLQATLVRELVDSPEQEGEIIGTSLFMDLISSIACMVLVSVFVSVVNCNETETIIVCILYSASLLFRASELIQCWFQYKLQAKYSSIVKVCAYVVVSAYKIYLLISQKNIYWFTVVNSIDYAIIAASLFVIYRKLGGQRLSVSGRTAARLFKRSKYYILSAMMVSVFQNTDHIMLKMINGDAENGIYSAAITCAGVCQFIYTAIIDSVRPVILTCKKEGSADYEKNISRLYCLTTYMALVQGVGFSIFAKLIITILFGEAYLQAVAVLRILVWYIAFSFMGSVRNIWILAEGKQKLVWKLNLVGVLMNIILNVLLIPVWGARGAAVGSLATQIFTNFLLGFFIKDLQDNNKLLIAGMNPRILYDIFCTIIQERSRNK